MTSCLDPAVLLHQRSLDQMHGPGGGDQPAGTRWSSLANWWPLPPGAGGTVTREEYERGLRPGTTDQGGDA